MADYLTHIKYEKKYNMFINFQITETKVTYELSFYICHSKSHCHSNVDYWVIWLKDRSFNEKYSDYDFGSKLKRIKYFSLTF